LYGTTPSGGFNGYGTVFKITPTGKLTTPHNFDYEDGAYPQGGLVQAINGDIYGTTLFGGANNSRYGTVFKITTVGTLITLHTFENTDGANPEAGLVQAIDGDFYGTTVSGGSSDGGTVFKITAGGSLTTLHSFCAKARCADGSNPWGPLVQATDGNFYGTTAGGGGTCDKGATPCGTVFQIRSDGMLTTLHTFDGTDGAYPLSGLVQDSNGNLYGTTNSGGDLSCDISGDGCGTVFRLTMGLGPFVETRPTSGKVGAVVIILGTNLTGASSVRFDGTAAKFKVVSKSEITTTVPTGATTGTVEVKTPKKTLKSNVVFRVTK
jgi:uncharacterized repeat protein (TIGR03803 family)